MATLTVNQITRTGLVLGIALASTLSVESAAASDQFPNDGKTFVMVANDDTDPHSVVFTSQKSVLGLNLAELIVAVVANMVDGEDYKIIGPFPKNIFNDANGRVQVTYKEAADGSGIDASADFSIIVFSL